MGFPDPALLGQESAQEGDDPQEAVLFSESREQNPDMLLLGLLGEP